MTMHVWTSSRSIRQACALALVCFVLILWAASADAQKTKGKETMESWPVQVPNVVGMNRQKAFDALNKLGLRPQQGKLVEADTLNQHDTIYRQSISGGTSVPNGSIVTLDITNFVMRVVPNVVGLRTGDAKARLTQTGFGYMEGQKVMTTDKAKDYTVVTQTPAAGDRPTRKIGVTVSYYVYSATRR